jgi:putative addiction module component (TIGR02574 family)
MVRLRRFVGRENRPSKMQKLLYWVHLDREPKTHATSTQTRTATNSNIMESVMDVAAVLREVEAWPIEDRLIESGFAPTLTDEQRLELDRRLDSLASAPGDVIPFEEIEDHVKRAG